MISIGGGGCANADVRGGWAGLRPASSALRCCSEAESVIGPKTPLLRLCSLVASSTAAYHCSLCCAFCSRSRSLGEPATGAPHTSSVPSCAGAEHCGLRRASVSPSWSLSIDECVASNQQSFCVRGEIRSAISCESGRGNLLGRLRRGAERFAVDAVARVCLASSLRSMLVRLKRGFSACRCVVLPVSCWRGNPGSSAASCGSGVRECRLRICLRGRAGSDGCVVSGLRMGCGIHRADLSASSSCRLSPCRLRLVRDDQSPSCRA